MQASAKVLRLAAIGLGWAVAVTALLIIGLYLAALAVNRHDQAASAEALALEAAFDALPAAVDSRNAFVHALGFAAPRGVDPWVRGVERAAWIRGLRAGWPLGRDSDPHARRVASPLGSEGGGFFDCPARNQRECFAVLDGADPGPWLDEREWIVERYAELLAYPAWREVTTYDSRATDPMLAATQAQRVWFTAAWQRAGAGDVWGVRELLRADLEFWRLVLAESHMLTSKLIAASTIERHFAMASIVLRRLPAGSVSTAVPPVWREPVTAEERSMRRVAAAALHASRKWLRTLGSGRNPQLAAYAGVEPEHETLMSWLDSSSGRALAQPQDFLNKQALQLTRIVEASEAPFERLPAALERARAFDVLDAGARRWSEPLYNFMLDALLDSGSTDYLVDAAARVADLEGVRRSALLTAELRARGVEAGEIESALAEAALADPYTHRAFEWDADAGAIVFTGIHPSAYRARRAFWY